MVLFNPYNFVIGIFSRQNQLQFYVYQGIYINYHDLRNCIVLLSSTGANQNKSF